MEACEFWWVLLENIEGCNFLIHQHANQDDNQSFLAILVHHLIARLPLTEAQVSHNLIIFNGF
jgi:hypothetical protein